ncbi:MAG: tetratricopeptide repeat protein [Promethearchaeota archaeon]
MKKLEISFKELLEQSGKLTFLVGAGCSANPPSNLPLGRDMIEAIVRYSCAESEVEKLLKMEDLRFEQVVEIERDQLDHELKIIDYYGECEHPNSQHYFLAEILEKGHFVITTNFDHLIELALLDVLNLKVPNDDIACVITEEDYRNPEYQDPQALFERGKMGIYKIHGSPKNILKPGLDTKKSLVATIQALGSGKEGESVFQLQGFKRPAFEALTRGRTLVVMGYSGSDDFDVVPSLLVVKDLKSVIWVDHVPETSDPPAIFEIQGKEAGNQTEPTKAREILSRIKQMQPIANVYLVKGNTSKLLESVLERTVEVTGSDQFPRDPETWMKERVNPPSSFQRYHVPYEIYMGHGMIEEAMSACQEILKLANREGNDEWKGLVLNNIGAIHYKQANFPEALRRFGEAISISEQLGDLSIKAAAINNMGGVFRKQGYYPEALRRYQEALSICEEIGDLTAKATALDSIGGLYEAQGDYPEALRRYQEALSIDEQLGNLPEKVTTLNNIGVVFDAQEDYLEALKRYEEALSICEQLGNLSKKVICLNNIGGIFRDQGRYEEAFKWCEEALSISENLGILSEKIICLNNIGMIHNARGDLPRALELYEEGLSVSEQVGDLPGKANCLNNMGAILDAQGKYHEALEQYEQTLSIDEQLGNLPGKAKSLFNIGGIYVKMARYLDALRSFREALDICERTNDLLCMAAVYNGISLIYSLKEHQSEALNWCEKAFQISEKLGNLLEKATYTANIATILYKQGNFKGALKEFEDSLELMVKLGLGETRNALKCMKMIKHIKNENE